MKKLLIIGGYGNVGKLMAAYLLKHVPAFEITIGGRNLSKARATAEMLMKEHPQNHISYCQVDASDKGTLLEAFSKVDMVVVAASSTPYVSNVVEAALEEEIDYFDTQLSDPQKIETLKSFRTAILNKQLVFITDGGYHPGIPGAMIHWAQLKLGSLTKANIYAALRMDWSAYNYSDATIKEMLGEFKSFQPIWFKDGEWTKSNWTDMPTFDFGEPYGEMPCTPMLMEEIKSGPYRIKELQDTGFFISGFNRIMDNYLMPIIWTGIKILPASMYGPLCKLFQWGVKLGKPPYGVRLVADCKGETRRLRMSVSHQDGYEITVIPVVACLKQYLEGHIVPGLHLQAWTVAPDQFFSDIADMGIEVVSEVDYQHA